MKDLEQSLKLKHLLVKVEMISTTRAGYSCSCGRVGTASRWRASKEEQLENARTNHELHQARSVVRELKKAETVLSWHYGPTDADPDGGKMWDYACGGEVWVDSEGYYCTKCGRSVAHEEE